MAYIGNSPENIQRGRRAVYEFTATASQTVFSGVDNNGITLDLQESVENDVYLNGSRLVFNDDYTIAGEVLTLTSGAAAGDILVIVTQDDIANVASYTKAEADARYINYDGDIVNGNIQVVGDISLGDNNKINLGADSDLQIFHDGNNSYINDAGTGDLIIYGANLRLGAAGTGEQFLRAYSNAQVDIYYDNAKKLATTSTGIDVTGNITFGDNHSIVSDNDDNLVIESSSAEDIIIKAGSGVVEFRDAGESGSPLQMKIDTDGNVLVGGNVNDTTPYNNSAGSTADNGIALGNSGIISAAKYNDSVLLLNRTGVNDGSIIDVKKNGNTVGTIGTVDGDLNVYATASGHKGLRFGNGYVAPTGNNTTVENGTTDLGLSTHRFKNLYLSGKLTNNGTGGIEVDGDGNVGIGGATHYEFSDGGVSSGNYLYLMSFNPLSNGQSGKSEITITSAGGITNWVLSCYNAGGTTQLQALCNGSTREWLNIIGYRTGTTVHVYFKPSANAYYTPRFKMSWSGYAYRDTSAASTPASETFVFSSSENSSRSKPLTEVVPTVNNYTPSSNGEVLAYGDVIIDRGGNYNNSTYKYTCPVDGDYLIVATFAQYNWAGDVGVYRNTTRWKNVEWRTADETNGVPQWNYREITTIIHGCAQGDELYLRMDNFSSTYVVSGYSSYFSDTYSVTGGGSRYGSITYTLL